MSNNNQTNATRESLWSLLSDKKYSICIPIIQRDYAQGRQNQYVSQIRNNFLEDIFDALKFGKEIDVNFIYGNVETNSENIPLDFIPIDGQQRLTTLFLLHWYLASWTNKLTPGVKEILKRFTYKTRFTTGGFCERLIDDVILDLKSIPTGKEDKLDEDGILTKRIKDYYWFFSSYENDASIKSMLVMLQAIHDYVGNMEDKSDADNYFDKLVGASPCVSFLFLDIKDVGLTDEIYIKMNARGKALTRFENFKAQLSSYLAKADSNFSNEFLIKINGEWAQFFWNKSYRVKVDEASSVGGYGKLSATFDDQMLALIRFFMLTDFIHNVEVGESSDNKYTVRKTMEILSDESDFAFVNRLFTDEFKNINGFLTSNTSNVNVATFKFISRILNVLAKRKRETGEMNFADFSEIGISCIDDENLFKRLIRATSEKELSYEDKVIFYAEMCFLNKYSNTDYSFDKHIELANWLRVVNNMAHNTLYNQQDDFFRSIKAVRRMVDNDYALDTYGYFSKLLKRNYKQGFGFYDLQVTEECIKANLILKSAIWKEKIYDAEKSFLGSQISAILSFSGIYKMYTDEIETFENADDNAEYLPQVGYVLKNVDDNSVMFSSFDNYLNKINHIFEKNELRPEMEKESIFRRALLCMGDGDENYLLPPGKSVQAFLDCNDRERSFRRLLRDGNSGKRDLFKQLLDKLDLGKDFIPQLQNIIDTMVYSDDNEWKRYFIEMPELIECTFQKKITDPMGEYVFRDAKRYVSMTENRHKILLLEKTMTTSINRELYSYVLFLKVKKEDLNVKYYATFGENEKKYLLYTNKQNEEIHVTYEFDNQSDEYRFIATTGDVIKYRQSMEMMLDYIKQSI